MANKENQKFIQSQRQNPAQIKCHLSRRVPMWRSLHRGNKKKLRSAKGRTREQVSQLRTGPSLHKTPNPRIHMEHCVDQENHFSEENNGRPANCLRETNPKQTSTFFHCETAPLGNNLIEKNQVVCKFPSCTTDDDRTV